MRHVMLQMLWLGGLKLLVLAKVCRLRASLTKCLSSPLRRPMTRPFLMKWLFPITTTITTTLKYGHRLCFLTSFHSRTEMVQSMLLRTQSNRGVRNVTHGNLRHATIIRLCATNAQPRATLTATASSASICATMRVKTSALSPDVVTQRALARLAT